MQQFSLWEKWIREGEGNRVRREIMTLSPKKMSRPILGQLANLCRRVGLSSVAVKILHPIVRSEFHHIEMPSYQEKLEYAAALVELGAVVEAQKIFLELEPVARDPRISLYFAFSYFRNWQYQESLAKLKEFIDKSQDDYQRIVGEVNLAAALTACKRTAEAGAILVKLESLAQKEKYLLLYGNILELQAQLYLQERKFDLAADKLENSQTALKETANHTLLYTKKWQKLIAVRSAKNINEAFAEFSSLLEEAKELRDWETIRDIDRQLGLLFQERALGEKLIYGSPFEIYRTTVADEFNIEVPEQYFITEQWQSRVKSTVLDVSNATLNGKNFGIKEGTLLHAFLKTIVSDFYRPFPTGTVFSNLFSEEYYNPFTAYDRIYQCVKRLRRVFADVKLPIEIRQEHNEYSLKVTGQIAIKVSKDDLQTFRINKDRLSLAKNLASNFSAQELALALNSSVRTANRIIKQELQAGKLQQLGQGKQTRFKKVS